MANYNVFRFCVVHLSRRFDELLRMLSCIDNADDTTSNKVETFSGFMVVSIQGCI